MVMGGNRAGSQTVMGDSPAVTQPQAFDAQAVQPTGAARNPAKAIQRGHHKLRTKSLFMRTRVDHPIPQGRHGRRMVI